MAESVMNYTSIQSSEHAKLFRIAVNESDLLLRNEVNGVICDINEKFGEFGIYRVYVGDNTCSTVIVKEPVNIYVRKYQYLIKNKSLLQ